MSARLGPARLGLARLGPLSNMAISCKHCHSELQHLCISVAYAQQVTVLRAVTFTCWPILFELVWLHAGMQSVCRASEV